MLNLVTLLEESARSRPTADGVVMGEVRLPWAAVEAAARGVAAWLTERGIQPGDRVALTCPNVPWFPVAYYGILKTGAAVVPLNVMLKPREIAYHLADSQSKALLCFTGTAELPLAAMAAEAVAATDGCSTLGILPAAPDAPLPPGSEPVPMTVTDAPAFDTVQRQPGDTAVILYTSGTTGQPKGAELSHSNLMMQALTCERLLKTQPDDATLVALPLFHSFGQAVQMNTFALAGAKLVLLPKFTPRAALKLMLEENITVFCGVPAMYWSLLHQSRNAEEAVSRIADQLRLCASGGAALPLEVLKGFEEKFNVAILEGYGLSETSPGACFNQLDKERKPGSIGTPLWGVEMRVVDENDADVPVDEPGEVVVRGHNIMKGYFNRPDETAEALRNGWFHTGDIGKKDADGYFTIVDRSKDMIVRGGLNVYPREIEEVMMTHEAVSLVAVVGVPKANVGEEVKAFVVLHEEVTVGEDDLLAWCRENMASYKCPRLVEFRPELPMNATGKILKRELRAEEDA